MLTLEEVAEQSVGQRLDRVSRTADDLAAAIRGQVRPLSCGGQTARTGRSKRSSVTRAVE